MKHIFVFLSVTCGYVASVLAQGTMEKPVIDDAIRKVYKKELTANVKKYAGNKDVLVRNGVVADRNTREIRVLAFSTGNFGDLPLEFVLVGERGKAYESLAVTSAKASDIHAAMTFVGMTAGHPIRQDKFELWSKGDPVDITVNWTENGVAKSYKASEVLKYPNAKKTIQAGWIFTGSYNAEHEGKTIYAADDAGDIISTFNSPWTVFDLAAGAGQKETYGEILPGEKFTAKHQTKMEFIIRPTLKKGETRNLNYVLELVPASTMAEVKTGDDLRFTLTDTSTKKAVVTKGKLLAVLEELSKVSKNGKLAYATLKYEGDLPVAALRDFVEIMHQITAKELLRIEPTSGQLFYQAYTPNDSWSDPEARPGQPLEFFLPGKAEAPIRFRYYDETYLDTGQLKLSEMSRTFKTDKELKQILDLKDDWLTQAVLFYVKPTAKVKDVQRLYDLVRKSQPIGFVFIK